MGMFDEIRCEYPLPDGFEPQGILFQTKDTPRQWLDLYVLQQDGILRHATSGEQAMHHGTLTFYATNIAGVRPASVMTSDGAPPWDAEYCALFDHGVLLKIEGGKQPYTTRAHVTKAEFFAK